ncbi:MAG TPA: hypothetical protein VEC57_07505 [Candidatus Limnocylindrales bacterium]|nr:hypothetical protein [Candidatus Limnocylindrales bacterium]
MKNVAASLLSLAIVMALALGAGARSEPDPEWTPEMWMDEDTLQFRTDCPDEGEHWSYVWLVVLEEDVYVRLGSRAAARVDCNKSKPIVAVRIADDLEFPAVEMVPSPDKADAVAAAMADKYWTDIFVRYADHPYTMKLVPKKKGEVLGQDDKKDAGGDDAGKAGAGNADSGQKR